MSKSILQSKKVCYFTGRTEGLHKHHCIYGKGNRALSEKYGLWVWIHHDIHNGGDPMAVHNNPNDGLDLTLKQLAQRAYEEQGHSREDFIREFGRSWL